MAETVTVTDELYGSVKKIKFEWTTHASDGTADGATTTSYNGEVLRVVQIPGSGGVQPTDLYDVTIVDEDGLDILFGEGANISNAAASQKHGDTDGLGCVANSTLTLHVSNAGNSKQGTTIVYLR